MSIAKLELPERMTWSEVMTEAFDRIEKVKQRMKTLDSIKRFELDASLLPAFNKIERPTQIDGSGWVELDYIKALLEAVSDHIEANADCTYDVYRTIDKINEAIGKLDEITV